MRPLITVVNRPRSGWLEPIAIAGFTLISVGVKAANRLTRRLRTRPPRMCGPEKWGPLMAAAFCATGCLFVCPLQAQDANPTENVPATSDSAPASDSRWFTRVGAIGAFYDNIDATVSAGGQAIPGATVHVRDNFTAIFEFGYDITKDLDVIIMSGIPPRATIEGRGTLAPYGTLGSVRYGPLFLTGIYHLPQWRRFRPYVGGGGAYAIIFKNYDGSVTNLKVDGAWGSAVQAGVEYRLSKSWGVFGDYKRLWIKFNGHGMLGPAPVAGTVTVRPDMVSAGFRYQFGRRK